MSSSPFGCKSNTSAVNFKKKNKEKLKGNEIISTTTFCVLKEE